MAWKHASTSSRGGLGLPLDPRRKDGNQKKTKNLAKVVVLLETCIDFGSKNKGKPKKTYGKPYIFKETIAFSKDFAPSGPF